MFIKEKIFFITLFLLSLLSKIDAITIPTLQDFEYFANHSEEFPPIHSINPFTPDYKNFYSTTTSKNIFQNLFFKGNGLLTHNHSRKTILQYLLAENLKLSESTENDFYIVINSTGKEKIYVWTDLYGAFHSLIRELTYLKNNNIIDNHFKILNPHTYFIFQGQRYGYSPYNIELMMVLLLLQNNNPNQVFIIKSKQEANYDWREMGFETELRIAFSSKRHEPLPAQKEIVHFFQKQSSGILILDPNNNHILFTDHVNPYDLSKNYQFINATDGKLISSDFLNTIFKEYKVLPLSILKPIDRKKDYFKPSGLDMLPQERTATVWNFFSSPTLTFKEVYNFDKDAFGQIDLKNPLEDSTITLFTHMVGSKTDFQKQTYDIVTGIPVDHTPSQIDKQNAILIISSLDLSGGASISGTRILRGIDLKIREQNQEGGLNGKLLKVFYYDDHYDPSLTLQFLSNFIKQHNVSIILTPLGTPTTQAILKFIQDKEIMVFFPFTGAPSVMQNDHFVNYRANYTDEAETLVKYAKENLSKQHFAFFYQNDAYGTSLLDPSKDFLENTYGITKDNFIEASYTRNSLNIEAASNKFLEQIPDVIFFYSTYPQAKKLVHTMSVNTLYNIPLMGVSFLSDRLRNYAASSNNPLVPGEGLEVIMSRVVPDPDTDKSDIVKEYREQMKKIYPGIAFDADSLESYINTSLLIKILQGIDGKVTLDKVNNYLKTIKNVNFRGLQLNFDEETRTFNRNVWLDLGNGPWILYRHTPLTHSTQPTQ